LAAKGVGADLKLMRAAAYLDTDPAAAAREAAALLRDYPDNTAAALLLGTARRACGDPQAAAEVFAALATAQPDSPVIQFEWGRTLAAQQQPERALAALQRAVLLEPTLGDAWLELAALYAAGAEEARCDHAYAQYRRLVHPDRHLAEASTLLSNGRLDAAESLLQRMLAQAPHDVEALRLLAEIATQREDFIEAEQKLGDCLRLAPGFNEARFDLARVLHAQQRPEAMLPLLERLLVLEPQSLSYATLQSAAYNLLGKNEESLAVLTQLLRNFPADERVWMYYGHALRAAGRNREAIDAYRESTRLAPGFAEAWFSFANLKTFRFSIADISTMRVQASSPGLSDEERLQFEFALGKALEDEGEFAASFEHYARGNALRRAAIPYDGPSLTRFVERNEALYTKPFFAARGGFGCQSTEPIFILGLPRSGSTLLEQILASHSQVEGTRELPYMLSIARELGAIEVPDKPPTYPQTVADLSRERLQALGSRYLAEAAPHRLLGRAHFIDKMPNNWMHVGLISLLLPNARIIDARRSALGCCVANFKQHFQKGMWFSYKLEDLGHYYRDYVRQMRHFDAVLPGRMYRVVYENLVTDLESEVRSLLAYCNLPFEEQCLRFYETRRVVQTVSSEQVRQPIYREGLDQWRNFEPWLGALKESLGDSI
jgi:tetratricopeptide (TPR) repeat protein